MMHALLLVGVLGTVTARQESTLTLAPVLAQQAVLYLSDDVTAGGAGGSLGVELTYRRTLLAGVDVGMLWLLGNTASTRFTLGAQLDGAWSPAGWLMVGALWGDRLEFLSSDGRRPAIPT